jgi:transcriptional regulator with XRE-family HTH domain
MNGGKIVRERRLKLGLSLKALAEKANVHFVFLSRLERGMERPSEDLVRRIAAALDYKGNVEELTASFGKVPASIEKLILDDPSAVVDLPAFFKSRRARIKKGEK